MPSFEQSLLDRKREMIRELTNSAWSILAESEREARTGLSAGMRPSPGHLADRVPPLRPERKDYFWSTTCSRACSCTPTAPT